MTDFIGKTICETLVKTKGCDDPLRPPGTCMTCRQMTKLLTDLARPKLTPSTMDDAAHMLAAAAGAECFVCRRVALPRGLTFKNLAICGVCAPLGLQREIMSEMNDTTDTEDRAGMEGIDRAGEYLASIDKFDLRDLTEEELRQFNAHWLNGFSESMRAQAEVQPPF